MSNPYKFNMYLFDNGELEEFLLLLRNFNMTLAALETLDMGTKVK